MAKAPAAPEAKQTASVTELDTFLWNGWEVVVLDVPDTGHGHDRFFVIGRKDSPLGDTPVVIGQRVENGKIVDVTKVAPVLTVSTECHTEEIGAISAAVYTALAGMADEDARVGKLTGDESTADFAAYWNAAHRLHRQDLKEARGLDLTADELEAQYKNRKLIKQFAGIAGDSVPARYAAPEQE